MQPAFRHGAMTPWGGNKLRDEFQKGCPAQTGESLEMSMIPGLESRDAEGRPLSELIDKYGKDLLGTKVSLPFPLLLKLIDAREQLSVQVHPGDDYAREKHGKLGKNEAWVILSREKGAKLTAGLKDGVTLEQLEEASKKGAAVEQLLRTVDVEPGDTYYIPEGTVHAIGAGLVIYEIQQSSDITYRLYDWNRVNEKGEGRELHLEDSLAVVDLKARPKPAKGEVIASGDSGARVMVLDNPYFRLDKFTDCKNFKISPDAERFSVITAVFDLLIAWEDGQLQLKAGQTALLPANGHELSLTGASAMWAAPAV